MNTPAGMYGHYTWKYMIVCMQVYAFVYHENIKMQSSFEKVYAKSKPQFNENYKQVTDAHVVIKILINNFMAIIFRLRL